MKCTSKGGALDSFTDRTVHGITSNTLEFISNPVLQSANIVTAYYHSHHVHGTMALSPSLKAVVGIDSQDALLLLSPCKVLIRLFI